MISVSGYSDDVIDIDFPDGSFEEIGSYDIDTIITFSDGTVLRMSYVHGTWRAFVDRIGGAQFVITKLIDGDDYYSDQFVIDTDAVTGWTRRKPP